MSNGGVGSSSLADLSQSLMMERAAADAHNREKDRQEKEHKQQQEQEQLATDVAEHVMAEQKRQEGPAITTIVGVQMIGFITGALALVAGLAWNEAIQDFFQAIFPDTYYLWGRFIYASAVSFLAVVIMIVLLTIATRLVLRDRRKKAAAKNQKQKNNGDSNRDDDNKKKKSGDPTARRIWAMRPAVKPF